VSRFNLVRLVGRTAFAITLLLFAACNQTPTEITPLPRALGEVGAVHFTATSLAPLPEGQGTYVLWGLGERRATNKLGLFYVNEAGAVVDGSGVPLSAFTTEDVTMRTLQGILVTIEANTDGDTPAGMQILSGTFIERVATLTVPISASVLSATGGLRVFTPTDGEDTNENAGVWMMDSAGEPSLVLPDTSAALNYETFIEVDGMNLNLGRFEVASTKDDTCRFCANFEEFDQPGRPGDDLLLNAPDGLSFPRDVSGSIVRISLEGRFNDFVQQSQLVILEAVLPEGLVGGEIIGFVNVAESFPLGRAALY
jgi:hypothetical protein